MKDSADQRPGGMSSPLAGDAAYVGEPVGPGNGPQSGRLTVDALPAGFDSNGPTHYLVVPAGGIVWNNWPPGA